MSEEEDDWMTRDVFTAMVKKGESGQNEFLLNVFLSANFLLREEPEVVRF